MRDLKQSLKFLEDEKSELQEERESIVKAKAKLELLIKDLEYGEMTEIEYQVNDDHCGWWEVKTYHVLETFVEQVGV